LRDFGGLVLEEDLDLFAGRERVLGRDLFASDKDFVGSLASLHFVLKLLDKQDRRDEEALEVIWASLGFAEGELVFVRIGFLCIVLLVHFFLNVYIGHTF